MSEKTRIIEVELNNYRQYYGKQKIDFSSREEGFTAILGESGHGKSNILNAINWCFYKDEPHGKKDSDSSSPVINTSYLKEQKVGTTARSSVRVILQIGDIQYSIKRVLTILVGNIEYETLEDGTPVMLMSKWNDNKIPEGCEIVDSETTWTIKKKDKEQTNFTEINEEYGYKMNQILPKRLSVFFLLDGEFLEKFWNNFERVEEGIEEISHLHLLNSAIKHAGDVSITKIIRTGPTNEKTILQNLITHNRYYEKSLGENGNISFSEKPRWVQEGNEESGITYHATGNPRIKDLDHDTIKMQRRSQDISRDISGVNVASAKILQKQFEDTEIELVNAKKAKDDAENKWRDSLVDKSVYVFAKDAIIDSVKIIENHLAKGDLPNETKTIFTSDLLERELCICKTDLKSNIIDNEETNLHRIAVTQERDRVTQDIGLDSAVKMRFSFKSQILDNYSEFLKTTFGDLELKFKNAEENQDKINRKLKGIKDQLGSAGNQKIQELIIEQDALMESIKLLIEEKKQIEITLKTKANENDANQQKIIRISAKDVKAEKEIHQITIWNKAIKQLQTVYDEMKNETRIEMQEKTFEIFKLILLQSEEFKKFVIKKDYQCVITNQEDVDQLVDLSAGQSLFLALSFVTALREITGYSFPLVIDSPLGKISGTNKFNLAQILPNYLKDEQLTFLATDTEWISNIPNIGSTGRGDDSFAELIEQKIPIKHFIIRKNSGRSQIDRIELKELMNNVK